MKIPVFHIDTFCNRLFAGNPAAVCVLDAWLPDGMLQAIAIEHHLPVTAFLKKENDYFATRWFTPEYEIDLCGHGLLASAFVIFNILGTSQQEIQFQTKKSEWLLAHLRHDMIELSFPEKKGAPIESSERLIQGLGVEPQEVYHYQTDRLLVIFDNEDVIKQLQPAFHILKSLPYRGIIVTAPSNTVDFVSRTFYPAKQIPEDFVTGASHCMLVPYWAKRLNKSQLHALQLSSRGGELFCQHHAGRVLISGQAVLFSRGVLEISSCLFRIES